MAERTFDVKKGWLIAPDAFGNMLPFFLHVRDKDIVWQSQESEVINNILRNNEVNDITEINPSQKLSLKSNDWRIEFDTVNKLCEIRASVKFTREIFNINENRDDLYANITLPVSFINTDEFNIMATLNTNVEQLSFSTISANKILDSSGTKINNMIIHIKNPIYKYPTSFATLNGYINSSLFIIVSGRFEE